jgi:hypothetical protein
MLHILITLCCIICLRQHTAHVSHNDSSFINCFKDIRWLWNLTFGFFQWHPIPMSPRGPSGCSLGHFCHSLATHLPLTCHSLATHSPLTDLMWATKVSTITKKSSKECVGKGMFGKFLPVLTWQRPMCVFHCKYHMFWRVRESPRVRHLEPFWLTLAPLSVWIWQNHVTTLLQNRWNISETIMLPSCYPHVTLMLRSCPSLAPHLPLTCNKNLWSQCASRQKHARPNGYWTQQKKIK